MFFLVKDVENLKGITWVLSVECVHCLQFGRPGCADGQLKGTIELRQRSFLSNSLDFIYSGA